jgi:hypothetical protein
MEWLSVAWERGEYETLRTLLHPNGSWAFVTNETRTFTDPDEFVEAIRYAQQETSYKLFTVSHEQLSNSILLARAYVRTPTHQGRGHNVGRHYFLVEVRDGRFYSSEHFPGEAAARAAFKARYAREAEPGRG